MSQHPDTEAAEKYAEGCDNESGSFLSHQLKAIRKKAHLKGSTHVRASLAPELEKVLVALKRISERNGFCLMGPPSEERDEMICALNGDTEQLVNRAFELGSARTNAECASEAREALEILSRLMGKGEG